MANPTHVPNKKIDPTPDLLHKIVATAPSSNTNLVEEEELTAAAVAQIDKNIRKKIEEAKKVDYIPEIENPDREEY